MYILRCLVYQKKCGILHKISFAGLFLSEIALSVQEKLV